MAYEIVHFFHTASVILTWFTFTEPFSLGASGTLKTRGTLTFECITRKIFACCIILTGERFTAIAVDGTVDPLPSAVAVAYPINTATMFADVDFTRVLFCVTSQSIIIIRANTDWHISLIDMASPIVLTVEVAMNRVVLVTG